MKVAYSYSSHTLYQRIIIVIAFGVFHFGHIHAQIPGSFYYDGLNPISLSGSWHFVPDRFLTYEEILADTSNIYLEVPGSWNNLVVNEEEFGSKGFGTYYAKIFFKKSSNLSNLAIKIPEIAIAYEVFVNETKIGATGKPGKSLEEETPMINSQIVELPPLNGGEVLLILHISNFRFSHGGLFYPPRFGDERRIRSDHEKLKTIKLLILGTVIILAVYMLYVFLSLKKEGYRVYFAVICLVLLLHTMSTGDMPLMDLFPGMEWSLLKKVAFVSFFLIGASNMKFLCELFPTYLNRRLINIYSIVSLVTAVFALIVPVSISVHLVTPFQISYVLLGIYGFEALVRATYARQHGARMLLIGFALAFIAAIADILSTQYLISLPRVAHYGMFAYILQMTMVMAMKYVNALKKSENIAETLSLSNEILERNVEERTRKVLYQNSLIDAKNKELESALKEQEDLMAIVAHDLKAPFNQIDQLVDLLVDEAKLKKNHLSYLDMILKVSENAKLVIENLVFLRSYQSDSYEHSVSSFNPVKFFESKILAFQKEAAKKKIVLEHAHSIKSKEILTDKIAVERIVDNLVSNAIKFSPSESRIVFEMLENENSLVIRVKDYGQGFSIEDKKKAFNKFQKLSAKPTAGELSTGLGLSIIKALVDNLQGDIKLYSEKDKGAEFIVSIPLDNTKG